jgi:hypothetical protein
MDRNVLVQLAELNRNLDAAIAVLEGFTRYEDLDGDDLVGMQAILREQAAEANVMVLEALIDQEEKESGKAFANRVAADKKRLDPDDCYFDVARREEERRTQGLPSLIGILRGKDRGKQQFHRHDEGTEGDERASLGTE